MLVTTDNAIIYKDVEMWKPRTKNYIYNVDAIQQSIENIIFVQKKEVPFLRSFGSELDRLLYLPVSDFTAFKIFHFLISAIDAWEPRVSIENSKSSVVNTDNQYDVVIAYKIKGIETQYYSISGALRPTILREIS